MTLPLTRISQFDDVDSGSKTTTVVDDVIRCPVLLINHPSDALGLTACCSYWRPNATAATEPTDRTAKQPRRVVHTASTKPPIAHLR